MPTKTTSSGVEYEVTAKAFIWYPADDNDNRAPHDDAELPPIKLPMRIKLRTVRRLTNEMDTEEMFKLLESLVPAQTDVLDEMDLNDFMAMFTTWQTEYSAITGASLGE